MRMSNALLTSDSTRRAARVPAITCSSLQLGIAGVAGVSWMSVNGNLAEAQRGRASRCGLGSTPAAVTSGQAVRVVRKRGERTLLASKRKKEPAVTNCRLRLTCCRAGRACSTRSLAAWKWPSTGKDPIRAEQSLVDHAKVAHCGCAITLSTLPCVLTHTSYSSVDPLMSMDQ